jgi:hypothetical protein
VKDKEYKRSEADPCMFFEWIDGRLVLLLLWVDDIIIFGTPADVKKIEDDIKSIFECKLEGFLTEYVGSKIDVERDESGLATVKFTQPVLVQKHWMSLNCLKVEHQGLQRRKVGFYYVAMDLGPSEATEYRSGTAIMLYMSQWSRPDCSNAVRDLTRHMSAPGLSHKVAMNTAIRL